MARIRTVKPEFFTSEDIVALTPLARLLYIAMWCEADKEGRFVWKPTTLKLRYFPGDNCDIKALCKEVTEAGLVVLYGESYAHIPAFSAHQHINPRETPSQLPDPNAFSTRAPRVVSRVATDSDGEDTRREEGKGRKGLENASPPAPPANGTRLANDWVIPLEWQKWAEKERPDLEIGPMACHFRDYWIAKPGKDGRKLDWQATWRVWVRNQKQGHGNRQPASAIGHFI